MNLTLFRDAIMLALVLMISVVIILIFFINDPKNDEGEVESPGSIVVTMGWDPGHIDVDLWLLGPGDERPVYFSNRGGPVWDLLRDDLGNAVGDDAINYENAFTRGMPPGDYVINAHCYRCDDGDLPVKVRTKVQVKEGGTNKLVDLIKIDLTMTSNKQEKTIVKFTVDEGGNVIRDSLTTFTVPIRSTTFLGD